MRSTQPLAVMDPRPTPRPSVLQCSTTLTKTVADITLINPANIPFPNDAKKIHSEYSTSELEQEFGLSTLRTSNQVRKSTALI
jgi:hypothetical protein